MKGATAVDMLAGNVQGADGYVPYLCVCCRCSGMDASRREYWTSIVWPVSSLNVDCDNGVRIAGHIAHMVYHSALTSHGACQ
jgi:hypothetical protein